MRTMSDVLLELLEANRKAVEDGERSLSENPDLDRFEIDSFQSRINQWQRNISYIERTIGEDLEFYKNVLEGPALRI